MKLRKKSDIRIPKRFADDLESIYAPETPEAPRSKRVRPPFRPWTKAFNPNLPPAAFPSLPLHGPPPSHNTQEVSDYEGSVDEDDVQERLTGEEQNDELEQDDAGGQHGFRGSTTVRQRQRPKKPSLIVRLQIQNGQTTRRSELSLVDLMRRQDRRHAVSLKRKLPRLVPDFMDTRTLCERGYGNRHGYNAQQTADETLRDMETSDEDDVPGHVPRLREQKTQVAFSSLRPIHRAVIIGNMYNEAVRAGFQDPKFPVRHLLNTISEEEINSAMEYLEEQLVEDNCAYLLGELRRTHAERQAKRFLLERVPGLPLRLLSTPGRKLFLEGGDPAIPVRLPYIPGAAYSNTNLQPSDRFFFYGHAGHVRRGRAGQASAADRAAAPAGGRQRPASTGPAAHAQRHEQWRQNRRDPGSVVVPAGAGTAQAALQQQRQNAAAAMQHAPAAAGPSPCTPTAAVPPHPARGTLDPQMLTRKNNPQPVSYLMPAFSYGANSSSSPIRTTGQAPGSGPSSMLFQTQGRVRSAEAEREEASPNRAQHSLSQAPASSPPGPPPQGESAKVDWSVMDFGDENSPLRPVRSTADGADRSSGTRGAVEAAGGQEEGGGAVADGGSSVVSSSPSRLAAETRRCDRRDKEEGGIRGGEGQADEEDTEDMELDTTPEEDAPMEIDGTPAADGQMDLDAPEEHRGFSAEPEDEDTDTDVEMGEVDERYEVSPELDDRFTTAVSAGSRRVEHPPAQSQVPDQVQASRDTRTIADLPLCYPPLHLVARLLAAAPPLQPSQQRAQQHQQHQQKRAQPPAHTQSQGQLQPPNRPAAAPLASQLRLPPARHHQAHPQAPPQQETAPHAGRMFVHITVPAHDGAAQQPSARAVYASPATASSNSTHNHARPAAAAAPASSYHSTGAQATALGRRRAALRQGDGRARATDDAGNNSVTTARNGGGGGGGDGGEARRELQGRELDPFATFMAEAAEAASG